RAGIDPSSRPWSGGRRLRPHRAPLSGSPRLRLRAAGSAMALAHRDPDGVVGRCDPAGGCLWPAGEADRSNDVEVPRVKLENGGGGEDPDGAAARRDGPQVLTVECRSPDDL